MTKPSSPAGPSASDTVGQLQDTATIEYKHELVRKAIHLCSLSIPIVYYYLTKQQALLILVPVTITFLAIDLARYSFPPVSRWFYNWFGWLLRKHEQDENLKRLSGATNVLLSACFCVLVFPKILTINAFSVLIISDTTSALIGRRYGRKRFFRKSLEGSLAFFISAALVIALAPKVEGLPMEYAIGIAASAIGAVVEAASVRIDDNISIPISMGAAMWLLYLLLLPAVNLFLMS